MTEISATGPPAEPAPSPSPIPSLTAHESYSSLGTLLASDAHSALVVVASYGRTPFATGSALAVVALVGGFVSPPRTLNWRG